MVRLAVARKRSSSRPSSSAIVRASRSRATPASGSSPQAREIPRVQIAWPSSPRAVGPTIRADVDRLAAQRLGLAEHPLEHPDLGERGEDERPLPGRLGRDELERAPVGHDRAVLVAGRPAIAPEPLVQEGQGDPIGPLVEPGDRRLGEGRRPRRSPVGERGVGGPGEQPGRGGRIGRAAAGDRPVVQLEGQLEVGQRVARRVDRLGQRRPPRSPPPAPGPARGRPGGAARASRARSARPAASAE